MIYLIEDDIYPTIIAGESFSLCETTTLPIYSEV